MTAPSVNSEASVSRTTSSVGSKYLRMGALVKVVCRATKAAFAAGFHLKIRFFFNNSVRGQLKRLKFQINRR